MTQRIDFSAPKQAGPVEIAVLTLDGGNSPVVLQQVSRDKGGKQTSLENLRTGKPSGPPLAPRANAAHADQPLETVAD